jgi:hypothetical protein
MAEWVESKMGDLAGREEGGSRDDGVDVDIQIVSSASESGSDSESEMEDEDGGDGAGAMDVITVGSDSTSSTGSSLSRHSSASPPQTTEQQQQDCESEQGLEMTEISHSETNQRQHCMPQDPIPHHPLPAKPIVPAPKTPMKPKRKLCFFQYHDGYCKRHRARRCPYWHIHDTSVSSVALITDWASHKADCQLPLCPVRSKRLEQQQAYREGPNASMDSAVSHPRIKDEIPSDEALPSAPQRLIKYPRQRVRAAHLPVLTCEKAERFERQKSVVEAWQAQNMDEDKSLMEGEIMDKKEEKRLKNKMRWTRLKERKKQKRREAFLAREKGAEIKSERVDGGYLADENGAESDKRILVDYHLPEGDGRAEWDTDELRRAFGEIG